MYTKLFFLTVMMVMVVSVLSADGDGKYNVNQYNNGGKYVNQYNNEGKYIPKDEGKYTESPDKWRYVHVHDMRERGKYIHIHIPYDGGYGPYTHEDWKGDYDPTGEYRELKSSDTIFDQSVVDPFKSSVYYIDKPEILEVYGFPNRKLAKRSVSEQTNSNEAASTNNFNQFISSRNVLSKKNLDTKKTQFDKNFDNRFGGKNDDDAHRKSRRTYNDEGGWRIIYQDGAQDETKYNFEYETENGIFQSENAKLGKENADQSGTNNEGYYHYTGDDGKLYRVTYRAGEDGFIPEGDHIFPAIQKALAYMAKQRKTT